VQREERLAKDGPAGRKGGRQGALWRSALRWVPGAAQRELSCLSEGLQGCAGGRRAHNEAEGASAWPSAFVHFFEKKG
jgi:hypothetical protein